MERGGAQEQWDPVVVVDAPMDCQQRLSSGQVVGGVVRVFGVVRNEGTGVQRAVADGG